MIAFCHIPKTAGTTLNNILWRQFIGRVVEAEPTQGTLYRRCDYERDLSHLLLTKVLIGHSIRPYEDYGPHAKNFRWVTFLREPRSTLVSTYIHQSTSENPRHCVYRLPFPRWLEEFGASRQTAWIAGSYNAQDAIKNLKRFAAVGLVERFDQSLVIFRHRLALPSMRLTYVPKNLRRDSSSWNEAFDFLEQHPKITEEVLGPDFELYNYAKETLFSEQLDEMGGERRVADLARTACTSPTRADDFFAWLGQLAYRVDQRLVYRPLSRLIRGRRESVGLGPGETWRSRFTADLP